MTIKQVQYVLPKGARILVTGANGFLASHTINELLRLGYIVRGTVRSPKPWLNAFYNTKYGPGKFETVIIEDLGNYFEIDSALDEVDGIVHLASDVSMTDDVKRALPLARTMALTLLEVASRRPLIRRVVIGSSSMAVYSPILNKEGIIVDENTWNISTMEKALAIIPSSDNDSNHQTDWNTFANPDKCTNAADSHYRKVTVYSAGKMLSEHVSWEWFKQSQPSFELNSVVSSFAVGRILHRQIPGSTMGWVRSLLYGNRSPMSLVPPKWFVDVEDVARLFTISLLDSAVSSERIFAFGESKNWTDIINILRELQPKNSLIPAPSDKEGRDLAQILPRQRAIKLLQTFYGQTEMTSIATSIAKGIMEVV